MSKIKNAIKEYREHGLLHTALHIKNRLLDLFFALIGRLCFSRIPLRDVIVIESHNDFDCNGGAFYDYLLEKGLNEKYRIVWLIRNKAPAELPHNVRCFDFFKPNLIKEYYCSVARFILNDDKFIEKRRKEQICVYCTHGGIGLKDTTGLIVVPAYVDYVLSSSAWYDPYFCPRHAVEYPSNRILHTGFPSNDLLFKGGADECARIRARRYSKTVLWMPTFRSNSRERNDSDADYPLGIPLVKTDEELDRIDRYCREHDCLLIIKIHPMQLEETYQALRERDNIAVVDGRRAKELGVDNYRLMRCCDAMISDYSSSLYSFLLLNRPVAFDFSDGEAYKLRPPAAETEGLTPGMKLYSVDDVLGFLDSVLSGTDDYREERTRLLDKLYEYRDGNASARLAAHLGLIANDGEGEREKAEPSRETKPEG